MLRSTQNACNVDVTHRERLSGNSGYNIKKMIELPLDENGSVPHDYTGKYGSSSVLMMRSKEGTGIIAGGPARSVLELAGFRNIRTKSLGSNNKQNVVLATIEGLKSLKTPEEVARLRGISVDQL